MSLIRELSRVPTRVHARNGRQEFFQLAGVVAAIVVVIVVAPVAVTVHLNGNATVDVFVRGG